MRKKVILISTIIMCLTIITAVAVKKRQYKSIINVPNMDSYITLSAKDIVNNQIEESIENNQETYAFFANMFGIDINNLKQEISESVDNQFNELDILNTGENKKNIDLALIEYLTALESKKPKLFNRKYSYKETNKQYVYNLIEYFVSLYPSVDVRTAKAITWIETGNLEANSMLRKNNIFGGMSNGKLTEYSSIEYGVYKYISLLKNNYFDKGLVTIEQIGYKYNPTIIDGVKQANPTWVNNVNAYRNKFASDIKITSVSQL